MVTRQQEDIVVVKHLLALAMLKIELMSKETLEELLSELDYRFEQDVWTQELVQKFVREYYNYLDENCVGG